MLREKDIFFVHTCASENEQDFVEQISESMIPLGFSVWDCADCQPRETEEYDSRTKGDGRLDMGSVARGRMDAFRRTRPGGIDTAELRRTLEATRAIVFLSQLGEPSDGVSCAIEIVEQDRRLQERKARGRTRYIRCNLGEPEATPCPDVAFDETILLVPDEPADAPQTTGEVWAFSALVARHLVEQTVGTEDRAAGDSSELLFEIERATSVLDACDELPVVERSAALAAQMEQLRATLAAVRRSSSSI